MHINHGQLFLNIGFAPSLSWIIALDPLIVSIFFWNSVGRLLIISANDLFWMWCNSAQSNVTQWNLIVGVYTLSSHNEQCKLFFWLPYFTSAVTCLITCTLHFEYLCSGFPSYGLNWWVVCPLSVIHCCFDMAETVAPVINSIILASDQV